MKQQPDKMTAYYYRAATINTDLYLDNQMYRLLHHAAQSGITAYVLYADHGYSGTNYNRPAFAEMLRQMKAEQIRNVIVTDVSRITRNPFDFYAFEQEAKKHGISVETVDGISLCEQGEMYGKLYAALATKGGECR